MYKFLLTFKMLRQRRITWLCIIGVGLGLGALIVVHSVMGGFATEVRSRIKGTLSDLSISRGQSGFDHYEEILEAVRRVPGVAAASPVLEGLAVIRLNDPELGPDFTRWCYFWGIDPVAEGRVSRFAEWLDDGDGRPGRETFLLEVRIAFATPDAADRWDQLTSDEKDTALLKALPGPEDETGPLDRFINVRCPVTGGPLPARLPPAQQRLYRGLSPESPIVLGKELATARIRGSRGLREKRIKRPGDRVVLSTVAFSALPTRDVTSYREFTVVDTWKSGMAEMDSEMAFIPLAEAQTLRKMPDRVTRIRVRLDDYRQADAIKDRLHKALEPWDKFIITTWEEERTTLLSAVAVEQNLMVILLFLIILVAGFMIMAILNMIVAEKTRDIGIVRAVGGSRNGVAAIFLFFGLAIGLAGCLFGIVAGLLFTDNINAVEHLIEQVTGRKVFSPEIYYFDRIPTVVNPLAIAWFVLGVLAVSLLSSALPAAKAARLDPVRAIQYE